MKKCQKFLQALLLFVFKKDYPFSFDIFGDQSSTITLKSTLLKNPGGNPERDGVAAEEQEQDTSSLL